MDHSVRRAELLSQPAAGGRPGPSPPRLPRSPAPVLEGRTMRAKDSEFRAELGTLQEAAHFLQRVVFSSSQKIPASLLPPWAGLPGQPFIFHLEKNMFWLREEEGREGRGSRGPATQALSTTLGNEPLWAVSPPTEQGVRGVQTLTPWLTLSHLH